jgi:hypothetical protein
MVAEVAVAYTTRSEVEDFADTDSRTEVLPEAEVRVAKDSLGQEEEEEEGKAGIHLWMQRRVGRHMTTQCH